MSEQITVARQMVGAELIRLYRNRRLMALALLVMLGPLVIALGYTVIEHASDPLHNLPAGGVHRFVLMLTLLALYTGPISAALIGAESGAGDLASGVFRDQVVTGRSRLSLFLAKVPAVVIVTAALSAVGFVVALGGAYAFAGGLPTPGGSLVVEGVAWLLFANCVVALLALGLASATGSRAATIATLIGWQLVLSPQLIGAGSLGTARDVLLNGALGFLRPGPAVGAPMLTMPVLVAVGVIAGWLIAVPALGAWRTHTRDA
jgi:ABC-type transport system involved in multi-copper enzyme maturation permease subunit